MAHEVAAHESHRAGASRRIFRLIPLAILLYFLSYGPAIRLATTGPRFEPAVRALYAPIRLLAQHCPPAQSALNSYVTWWRPTLDACINNLRQIDGAKQQWAIDNRISQTNFTVTWRDIEPYFRNLAIQPPESRESYGKLGKDLLIFLPPDRSGGLTPLGGGL